MRWLYIAALASMLILLTTVMVVVQNIRNKSLQKENDPELDELKFAPARQKKNLIEESPGIPRPVLPMAAQMPIPAQTPAMTRPRRAEFQSNRPKSGALLLAMMAGAAILMLARTQKNSGDVQANALD